MKKHEWMYVLIPLILTIFFDQITKEWASHLNEAKNFGVLYFILHHNHGAMLGLFSELPAVLRIVSLSTGGAFLFCTYVILQYLLPTKSLKLRMGLSMLIGGILGNVLDRILRGPVIDFITFQFGQQIMPVFNVADAVQWVGYFFIVTAIMRDGELLWPENNVRKQYWINSRFQLKYCFLLMAVGLGVGLISMVFSYTYLRVSIIEIAGANPLIVDKFLIPFALTFAVITVGFSVGLFTVGKIISHKIAGPVYAFEKFINDSLKGTNRPFKLRTHDEFKHLEDLALQMQKQLIEHGIVSRNQNAEPLPPEILEMEGSFAVDIAENEKRQQHKKA